MSDDVTLTQQELAALREAVDAAGNDYLAIAKGGMTWQEVQLRHLAPVVAGIVAARVEAAVDALADRLPELTEGKHREGTAHWPEHARDTYSLAIEEAQAAMRAALASATAPQGEGGEQ